MSHFHRIVVCVDVKTDERLGNTKTAVKLAISNGLSPKYGVSNVNYAILDMECYSSLPDELPKMERLDPTLPDD